MKRSFIWGWTILLMILIAGCDMDPLEFDGSREKLSIEWDASVSGDGGVADEADTD